MNVKEPTYNEAEGVSQFVSGADLQIQDFIVHPLVGVAFMLTYEIRIVVDN